MMGQRAKFSAAELDATFDALPEPIRAAYVTHAETRPADDAFSQYRLAFFRMEVMSLLTPSIRRAIACDQMRETFATYSGPVIDTLRARAAAATGSTIEAAHAGSPDDNRFARLIVLRSAAIGAANAGAARLARLGPLGHAVVNRVCFCVRGCVGECAC